MKNKEFIGVFIAIIFSVFLYVPIKEVLIRLHVINYYRSDNWQLVSETNDPVYDKIMTLESFISNRYNNYFPLYNEANSLYYNLIINIDKNYLNDIYLKDNNDNEHLFYNKDNFYYLVSNYRQEELENRLDTQVNFYNDINDKYPGIHLAVYIPSRYDNLKEVNLKNMNEYVNIFQNKLNNNIHTKFFNLTKDEYLNYYYRTDHHFNSYGAKEVYKDLTEILGITSNLDLSHVLVRNPYYGSHAKSTMLTRVSDTLTALDYPNNLKVNINDSKFKPLTISEKPNKFYDYYVGYFSGMYNEVIYDNGNNYDRNLLIIGDSLVWQVDYLLANSFDKTYVVNMKYGKWLKNDLVLSDYIKDNNITHILFLREAKNIIFDADNFKLDKRVIR